jgi:hypothetical protein
MSTRLRWVMILPALALGLCLLAGILAAGSPIVSRATAWQEAAKAPAQETGAAPRPAKERIAVNVLLAWTWLSIAVLFWLVRLRVREADRVYRMGLRGPAVKSHEDAGR